jgi:ABC-type branched-subunit amino acid transport system ATPase component
LFNIEAVKTAYGNFLALKEVSLKVGGGEIVLSESSANFLKNEKLKQAYPRALKFSRPGR